MNIGIYTYGTRGDLQPYVALALGLMEKGHQVTVSATEDFAAFVEGFGVSFDPLAGNAEAVMNSEEGQRVLKAGNPIQLMKYYFKILHDNLGDFDLLDFPAYNKWTYRLARTVFWQLVKRDTNEYRKKLGLPAMKENLLRHLDKQQILDLYCISPSLIPQPKDWASHHKITGFFNFPKAKRETHYLDQPSPGLTEWLAASNSPIYFGFGSNGVGSIEKFTAIVKAVLDNTDERILFCTGWSIFDNLPRHKNLFVTRYVNHETILLQCKAGIFHGGAGTLATMLRNQVPVIIVSFYTDQPTWGKIVEQKRLGIHIPAKKLTAEKLIAAIQRCQGEEIKRNVAAVGQAIVAERGVERTIAGIEDYFAR